MTQFTYMLDLEGLRSLAKPFAQALRRGDVVFLWGDLGVGKTTFARELIQALTNQLTNVPSPTFTLVQTYDSPHGEVWHCDLYRLKSPQEALELGLEDAFHHSICLIEWPERLEGILPSKRIDVTFKIVNETTRKITIHLVGSHDKLTTVLKATII